MRSVFLVLSLFISFQVLSANVGKMAPDFELEGADGKMYKLSQFKGKLVVLEWLNHGCPFVRKHYDSKNMQNLQKEFTTKDVVWLSIISSAPGKQGHSTPVEAMAERQKNEAHPTQVLLDPEGKVGQVYGAKTTPHMYVIDKDMKLVYKGAIDSIPSADKGDLKNPELKNYVTLALNNLMHGKPVKVAKTQPYGCSVKYKN